VPVWDFAAWSHLGGGIVQAAQLCSRVIYGWRAKSQSHAAYDPEADADSLAGGAVRVGSFMPPECAPTPPPAPPAAPPAGVAAPLDGNCSVAAGATAYVDAASGAVRWCEELVVAGTLELHNDTRLSARRVEVLATGALLMGRSPRGRT
jgi:hypothetical protein